MKDHLTIPSERASERAGGRKVFRTLLIFYLCFAVPTSQTGMTRFSSVAGWRSSRVLINHRNNEQRIRPTYECSSDRNEVLTRLKTKTTNFAKRFRAEKFCTIRVVLIRTLLLSLLSLKRWKDKRKVEKGGNMARWEKGGNMVGRRKYGKV